MASQDESSKPIASVYAQALFELAGERDQEEEVARQLAELRDCAARDADFQAFLSSDAIDEERRGESMERMFRGRLSDTLLDALHVLNRRGRLGLVPVLAERFEYLRRQAHNRTEASVVSAVPLEKRERRALVDELGTLTGCEVLLSERVDESIVGGLIVQIGDRRMDASVATQLARLRANLLARGLAEIHSGKEYFTPDA